MAQPFITEHGLVARGGAGLCCDEEGVALGPIPIIVKADRIAGAWHYHIRPHTEIADALWIAFGTLPQESVDRWVAALASVAKLMTEGSHARAAITAVQMGLPRVPDERMAKLATSRLCKFTTSHGELAQAAAEVQKASPDDPIRPGWPAGTPDSRGGEFRPKHGGASAGSVPLKEGTEPSSRPQLQEAPHPSGPHQLPPEPPPSTAQSAEPPPARGALRVNLLGLLRPPGGIVPVAPRIASVAASLPTAAIMQLGLELLVHERTRRAGEEINAAMEFANKGPRTLEDLLVRPADGSYAEFSTFNEFKKIELSAELLAKFLGPPPPGYDYHHIVMQGGANAARFTGEQLHNSLNLARIPRLFHEEIHIEYSRPAEANPNMSLREWVLTQPYEVQYQEGLKVLRKLRILK